MKARVPRPTKAHLAQLLFVAISTATFVGVLNRPILILGLLMAAWISSTLNSGNAQKPDLIDIGILLFYVSSILSTVLAYDIATSIPQLILRTIFILFYISLRSIDQPSHLVLLTINLGIALEGARSLITLVQRYAMWSSLGFSHLIDFRAIVSLNIPGVRTGNHYTIYIIAPILAIYALEYMSGLNKEEVFASKTSLTLALICVLLTFSRGLYIAVATGITVSLSRAIFRSHAQKLVRYFLIFIAAISITYSLHTWSPVLDAVVDTAIPAGRTSQVLSVHGRLNVLNVAVHAATSSGWIGFGPGNYALAVRHLRLAGSTNSPKHALNSFLEVTVEQGAFGLLAMFVTILGVLKMLHGTLRGGGLPLLGGYLALFLYGFTQSFVIADEATAIALSCFVSMTISASKACHQARS